MSRERIVTTPKSGLYHLRTLETFFFCFSCILSICHSWFCKAQPYPHILQFRCIFTLDFLRFSLTFFHHRFREHCCFCQVPAPPKTKKKKVTPCLCKVVRRPCLFSHALVQVGSACHVSTREVLPSSHVADSIGKRNFEGLNNSGFYWPPSYGSSQAHFHFLWTGAL